MSGSRGLNALPQCFTRRVHVLSTARLPNFPIYTSTQQNNPHPVKDPPPQRDNWHFLPVDNPFCFNPTMDSATGREDVVHPEVRAYINSLVSAVSRDSQILLATCLRFDADHLHNSSEASAMKTMASTTDWEMTHSTSFATSRNGFDSTMNRTTAWMSPGVWRRRILSLVT